MSKDYVNYSKKNEEFVTPTNNKPEEEVKVEVIEEKKEEKIVKFVTNSSGKFLNLRQKPNNKSEVLKVIPKESKMMLIEKLHDWTKVEFEGTTGFVMNEFIKEV